MQRIVQNATQFVQLLQKNYPEKKMQYVAKSH